MKCLWRVLIVVGFANAVAACGSKSSTSAAAATKVGWCGVEAASADGSVGIHSPRGFRDSLPIQLHFSTEMTPEQIQHVLDAAKTWEAAVGMTLFQRAEDDPRKGDAFTSLNASLGDGTNGVYLDDHFTTNTSKETGVLATTVWEQDPNDRTRISNGDIRINATNYAQGDADTATATAPLIVTDLETVVLHEMGHLLGLAHVTQDVDAKSALMPTVQIGPKVKQRRISRGDLARIREVYPGGDLAAADKLEYSDDVAKP